MKVVLSLCFVALGFMSYAQSGMYIVTEKCDGVSNGVPTFDSVYVTSPSGVNTLYSMPHIMKNLPGHNLALNKVFNNILQQGYKLVESYNSAGYAYNNMVFSLQTWYFVKP